MGQPLTAGDVQCLAFRGLSPVAREQIPRVARRPGYLALQGLRDNSPTPLRVRLYPCNFPHERFSAHDRPTFHGIQHLRFLRCAQS